MNLHQAIFHIVLLMLSKSNMVSRSSEMCLLFHLRFCMNTLFAPLKKLVIDTSIIVVQTVVAAQMNDT